MWSFFAALFGAGVVGGQLAKEKMQIAKAKADSEAVQASNVVRHAPRGGLWQSMIRPYPDPETGVWDEHSWGYQHPQTKEWYMDFNFTTAAGGTKSGMWEALERHKQLARYDKVYSGVFTYFD